MSDSLLYAILAGVSTFVLSLIIPYTPGEISIMAMISYCGLMLQKNK